MKYIWYNMPLHLILSVKRYSWAMRDGKAKCIQDMESGNSEKHSNEIILCRENFFGDGLPRIHRIF